MGAAMKPTPREGGVNREVINLDFTAADRVLPCPFCGGTDLELRNSWTPCYWIECVGCKAQAQGAPFWEDSEDPYRPAMHEQAKASAMAAWNRRPVPKAADDCMACGHYEHRGECPCGCRWTKTQKSQGAARQ